MAAFPSCVTPLPAAASVGPARAAPMSSGVTPAVPMSSAKEGRAEVFPEVCGPFGVTKDPCRAACFRYGRHRDRSGAQTVERQSSGRP